MFEQIPEGICGVGHVEAECSRLENSKCPEATVGCMLTVLVLSFVFSLYFAFICKPWFYLSS